MEQFPMDTVATALTSAEAAAVDWSDAAPKCSHRRCERTADYYVDQHGCRDFFVCELHLRRERYRVAEMIAKTKSGRVVCVDCKRPARTWSEGLHTVSLSGGAA
ncbi:hypothetical protein D5S18_00335 [Nocardia panacis]|uniref:Uncharacterized protein n=1 Tax=Nocardia panacis TaxID=2340916 RepID=A0A3A4KGY7_9NOCA|nr:hypothetical protein D5S18_00335 [Nocardia panacis]